MRTITQQNSRPKDDCFVLNLGKGKMTEDIEVEVVKVGNCCWSSCSLFKNLSDYPFLIRFIYLKLYKAHNALESNS